MTYLELVNEVLARLRENSVATVTQTNYSKLIGLFVNDAKRAVEDAWNWDALYTTIPVTTVVGQTDYVVTGSGLRHKDSTVNNATVGSQAMMTSVPYQWIQNQLQLATVTNATPGYYAWNGNNGVDGILAIYPPPNGIYTLDVNLCVPQVKLVNDSDVLTVQPEGVILGAYARALVERGEDGGLASSEAAGLAKNVVSDYIAIEISRDEGASVWVPA